MNSLTDQQLLGDYSRCRSEAAFAELVRRHMDFVHSAALRMVRDAHLAEDVTQGVFVALAQNARHLVDCPVLCGWLHRTTRNLAANAVRADVRRRAREQEAAAMKEVLAQESDSLWEQIAPQLDHALGELSEADRDALLLRYFERKSAREMAQTLGTSEEAAQKRVTRAVEHLRELFAKRGVTVGASGLVVVISANAVQAAPAGLGAILSSAAATVSTTTGTTAASATQTIAMTTLQKTFIAVTLTAAMATGIYEARQASHLRAEIQTLQQEQASFREQIAQATRRRDEALRQLAGLRNENERLNANTSELLKLRSEVARLRQETKELGELRAAESRNDPTEAEMKSWLSRVNQLRQHLEQSPGQKIPEFQFLTETDWLDATRDGLNTEADYRKAMSALRRAGETKFARTILQPALKEYMQANSGRFPTDFSQVQSYFKSPVDDAILQRWEIAPASTVKSLGLGGDVIITQRAPVDDVYDTRFGIGPYGFGSTDFLSSLTREALAPLNKAFSAANNGRFPEDLSQLFPYVTTPEQKAALEKLIQKRASEK